MAKTEDGEPMETMKMWIGGRWTASSSGKTVYAVNPATEKRIARLSRAGEQDVARAMEAAGKILPRWSKSSVAARARVVSEIGRVIRENAADLGRRETDHRGTPVRYTIPGFLACADAFETASAVGPVLMNNLIDPGPWIPYYLRPEPVGVCSFSPPWHAPFRTIAPRLASALVAGNTCVVESPANDSLTALKLAELVDSIGVPSGVLNILTSSEETEGDGSPDGPMRKRGGPGSALPQGRKEIPHLAGFPHPLPLIVLEDADVDNAVEKAMLTAFGNSGLAWALPGRYYVHESLYDVFADKFVAAARAIVVGNPADPRTDLGPAVSTAHRKRVRRRIEEALREGARLLAGGPSSSDCLPERGYFLPPTVLGDVASTMAINGHEIFGPVACLSPFSSVGQILDLSDREVLGPDVRICTADPSEEARIAATLSLGEWWGDEQTEREESTACAFTRGRCDFSFSIRFNAVYKDYTNRFIQRDIPNQN